MKKIKFKKTSIIFLLLLTCIMAFSPMNVVAETEKYKTDRIYISKTDNMWDDYVNMMYLVFPGQKISGLYYHKLYAEYDAEVGGFVVVDKYASHISYTKDVGEASLGLCFSYNPEYKDGNDFGKKNFAVWSKLRKGDILRPRGIDFTNKTINSTGTLSDDTLDTNAYFEVSYSKKEKEPTAYSNKTIVALGDSVTCNGGWTEVVSDMTGSTVINSGVSADRVTEGLKRFETDVLSYSPDIVLLMFGINDCVQYHYSDKTVENFKKELVELYIKCTNIGAKVVFISPNNIKTEKLNFDRYKNYGGLSECYPKFIKAVEETANITNSYYLDVYSLFDDTENLLCDSVHPNKKGYELISFAVSDFLISYADRICGGELSGFVSSGVEKIKIEDQKIILPPCDVKTAKTFFCGEIKVYENGKELKDSDLLNNNCLICWIDKNGIEQEAQYIEIK